MLNFLRIVVLMPLLLGPVSAQHVPEQCRPNGCGPAGYLGWFVPNTPLWCNFKAACDAHDICYGRCITGCSEISGTAACDGDCKVRIETKRACDAAFLQRMKADNVGKPRCVEIAQTYFDFVSHCGCSFFKGFIETAGRLSPEDRAEFQRSAEALRQFKEFRRRNPDNKLGLEIQSGLDALKLFGICDDNRFKFWLDNGRPMFSIQSRQLPEPPPVTTDKGDAVRPLRLLSGIDVTQMSIDGQPFDLRKIAPKLSPDLLRNLKQIDSFK